MRKFFVNDGEVITAGISQGDGPTTIFLDTKEISVKADEIFFKYASKLQTNQKAASEVIDYIKSKYSTEDITASYIQNAVQKNMILIAYGSNPSENTSFILQIKNEGSGAILYEKQKEEERLLRLSLGKDTLSEIADEIEERPIRVFVEQEYNRFSVENSQYLADEIVIYRGLSEEEIQNKWMAAQYISVMIKHGLFSK